MNNVGCRTARFTFSRTRDEHPRREAYALHAHENFELLYIVEGKGHFLVEGREYPLAKNTAMIMRPGEVHRLLVEEDSPYERVCVNVRGELFRELDPEGLLLAPFLRRGLGERNRYRLSCGEELMELLSSGEESGWEPGSLELTAQMFLLRCLFEIRSQQGLRKLSAEPLPLEPVLGFINENLGEELSLRSVAARFYVSPAQLNRQMKRSVGTTFWSYVMVKRLLFAKSLLQQGIPAGEASRRCGFGEYSAFYRAYKKHFGVAPRADFRGVQAVFDINDPDNSGDIPEN